MADTVIIHYSGHSIPEKSKDNAPEFSGTYLIVHDTEFDPKLGICINGITSEDLHGLVSMIPAERKTLILDTHPRISFNELVKKDGKYPLLLASDSAEIAYERQIKVDGDTCTVGAFTSTLVDQFEKFDSSALTHGKLIDAVIQDMSTLGFDPPQTPILIGNRYTTIFAPEDIYLNFYDFSNLRNFASHPLESLVQRYSKYRSLGIRFAKGHYTFGRAFLEKNKYSLAIDALQTALQQQNGNYREAILALGKAQVLLRGYTEALKTFQEYIHSSQRVDRCCAATY